MSLPQRNEEEKSTRPLQNNLLMYLHSSLVYQTFFQRTILSMLSMWLPNFSSSSYTIVSIGHFPLNRTIV